jgi:hypothetical protein
MIRGIVQNFQVFQSLWAMERRQPDGFERSLEENIAMCATRARQPVLLSDFG